MDRGRSELLAADENKGRTMTKLSGALQAVALTMDDLRLLVYVQHMAETAQSDAARHMFQEYMELEKRRLGATGGAGVRTQAKCQTRAMAD